MFWLISNLASFVRLAIAGGRTVNALVFTSRCVKSHRAPEKCHCHGYSVKIPIDAGREAI